MARRTEISMKLLIDPQTNNVLFAEADSDCVNFLFNLTSLPLSAVHRLMEKVGVVGCLGNIYDSFESLSEKYRKPGGKRKAFLLQPIADEPAAKVVKVDKNSIRSSNDDDSVYSDGSSSSSNTDISDESDVMESLDKTLFKKSGKSRFVKKIVVFMVSDDLEIKPISTLFTLDLLKKNGVKDVSALKELVVQIGNKEAVKLLKASLNSKKVLTQVFQDLIKAEI